MDGGVYPVADSKFYTSELFYDWNVLSKSQDDVPGITLMGVFS
jgi:hypothetical protein